jgi:hypothetical protein
MLTEVLCESLQSLQANANLKIGPRPLTSELFLIHHSLISLSFDPTLYESPKNVVK